jgi:NADPH:quinone reductase-like Zn-dependent oxidoreductase
VLPTWAEGTWSEKVVVSQDSVLEVPDADPLQLAMLAINPPTAHQMLTHFVDLQPGDWVGQTAANSAVGRHVVALGKLWGLNTLNVVRRDQAAEDVRNAGGEVVLTSGLNLAADIARALDGQQLRLVIDPVGGAAAAQLVGALSFGGTAVSYGSLTGVPTDMSRSDLLLREVRHTGYWVGNWYRTAPRSEIVDTLSYLGRLVTDGDLKAPVEATYHLEDYREAFEHALASKRGGKVLFTFD